MLFSKSIFIISFLDKTVYSNPFEYLILKSTNSYFSKSLCSNTKDNSFILSSSRKLLLYNIDFNTGKSSSIVISTLAPKSDSSIKIFASKFEKTSIFLTQLLSIISPFFISLLAI